MPDDAEEPGTDGDALEEFKDYIKSTEGYESLKPRYPPWTPTPAERVPPVSPLFLVGSGDGEVTSPIDGEADKKVAGNAQLQIPQDPIGDSKLIAHFKKSAYSQFDLSADVTSDVCEGTAFFEYRSGGCCAEGSFGYCVRRDWRRWDSYV